MSLKLNHNLNGKQLLFLIILLQIKPISIYSHHVTSPQNILQKSKSSPIQILHQPVIEPTPLILLTATPQTPRPALILNNYAFIIHPVSRLNISECSGVRRPNPLDTSKELIGFFLFFW